MTARISAELPAQTEASFTSQVLQLAKLCGWRTAHFRPARTNRGWRTAVSGDGAGFPDVILVRGLQVLAVELKTDRGLASEAQQAWLVALRLAGVETHVWRPENWPMIEKTLKGDV